MEKIVVINSRLAKTKSFCNGKWCFSLNFVCILYTDTSICYIGKEMNGVMLCVSVYSVLIKCSRGVWTILLIPVSF